MYSKRTYMRKSFLLHKKNRQRPIFAYTIVSAEVLNFCVRDGNRCVHFAIVTD